jgi:hypothetical protein
MNESLQSLSQSQITFNKSSGTIPGPLEKIEIILNNIKNKHYTSFDFNIKKRKLYDVVENDLEISYTDNKFYITNKNLRKNIVCNDCPICYEKIKNINKIILECKHIFCTICHYNWEKTCFLDKKELSCPLCRKVSNVSSM